VLHHIKN